MASPFSLSPLELLCLGAFGLLAGGATVALIIWLARRFQDSSPERVAKGTPDIAADPASHAEVVARIARRFCPRCRAVLTSDAPEGLCPACLLAGGLETPQGLPTADGDLTPAADLSDLQAQLPQLEILELLGQGGMGAVYKARQKNLDRFVALKIIRPDNTADPSFADRFEREARALARLNHPSILTIYDFGRAGNVCWLLMEFVDGVNLRQTMRAGGLSPSEALAIVPQICDALQYAHDQGVVHRDIKPENVLLDRLGRVKIADFGLAKLLGINPDSMTLTLTQHVVGTPRYMAPEQIERPTAVDHRADIYSLGVVIYEMLTGELPVGHFPLPSQKVQVDVRIDEVVLRALAKEPEKRFQQASQVKSSLASAANWPSPLPKPAPVTAELANAASRRRARRLVRGPAIGLMATGILSILPFVLALGMLAVREAMQPQLVPRTAATMLRWESLGLCAVNHNLPLAANEVRVAAAEGYTSVKPMWSIILVGSLSLVSIIPALLILAGGWQMRQLESYGLAMIASIMALLPCTLGWPLGLPMGIWALTVLSRREIRESFDT